MRAWLRMAVVVGLVIGAVPSAAHAQQQRDVSARVRILPGPFLAGIHASSHFSWLTSAELDAGVSLFELVEIEGGAFHAFGFFETGYGVQARAGLAPVMFDTRKEWRGWTIGPSVLGGYRYVLLDDHCREGTCRVKRVHDLTFAAGADFGWWAAEHFGFFMRPMVEIDLAVARILTSSEAGFDAVTSDFGAVGPILGWSFTVGFGF